jgi:hypothetical protein
VHRLRLAFALTCVLAPAPAALAGPPKSPKPQAARKAAPPKRSTRVKPATPPARRHVCTRVILDDVPMRELRLIGIVRHRRVQKALLMDTADAPSTIEPGECVGVERVPYADVVKPLTRR